MTASPERPLAIVFDWDNTLVDTWPTIYEALSVTFETMGHEPWTFEETTARVRHSLRDAFPVLFGDRWAEARDVFYAAFERCHIERLVAMEGAEDLLRALSKAGLFAAILSNKTGRYLRDEVDHLGWAGYFTAIVGAGDAERDKPERHALDLALNQAGCAAGPDVWVVGDTGIDMEVAHRTGCIPILVHRDDLTASEFREWPPRHIFTGCNSLLKLVARWQETG